MADHVGSAHDAVLFPAAHGGHLAPSTWDRHWCKAREAAGRPDLRLHDLRHTGLTWLAHSGATTRELMDIAGHSSPAAALRHQHVADGRKRELATRLSKLVAEG
jgi:integrase